MIIGPILFVSVPFFLLNINKELEFTIHTLVLIDRNKISLLNGRVDCQSPIASVLDERNISIEH